MELLVLTKVGGFLGPFATIFGWIFNLLYILLSKIYELFSDENKNITALEDNKNKLSNIIEQDRKEEIQPNEDILSNSFNNVEEEKEIEIMKEAIRGIRNVRTSMNVPPSKKAQVYVVSEKPEMRAIFEEGKLFFASLAYASEVIVQEDKSGIADDAVSVVIANANVYIPFAELVDIAQEIERLEKEEKKLAGELARVNGMLNNANFVSKAPSAKIEEEKAKLEKYTQMMEQVKERLAQLR